MLPGETPAGLFFVATGKVVVRYRDEPCDQVQTGGIFGHGSMFGLRSHFECEVNTNNALVYQLRIRDFFEQIQEESSLKCDEVFEFFQSMEDRYRYLLEVSREAREYSFCTLS